MKKILALGLAGALALSALAGSIATSEAAPFHPHNSNNGGWGAGAVIAGTILGLGIAAAAQPYYYPPAPAYYPYPAAYPAYGYGGNAHVQWCFQHYPNSYNPGTNTYVGYDGVTYYCNAPY